MSNNSTCTLRRLIRSSVLSKMMNLYPWSVQLQQTMGVRTMGVGNPQDMEVCSTLRGELL